MMPNLLLNIIAISLYITTCFLIATSIKTCIKESDKTPPKTYFIFWGAALLTHFLSITMSLSNDNSLSFNFVSLCSYVMCFISIILFIATLNRRIHSLGIIILPFTVLSIVFLMFSNESSNYIPINSGLSFHILSSLLAYSTLMLSAIQSILLAMQNNFLHQRIKNPKHSHFIRTLPSLEDMEYFLFNLIGIGILLLSISLLSGFYFLDNLFGSHVAHKTILSLFSWIIYSALLLGRWKYGWRGKTAVRWTITGFIVLALAFFGSKFIQEFITEKEVSMTINDRNQVEVIPPPHFLLKTYTLQFDI